MGMKSFRLRRMEQYILEKEEFFNEESGSWEVFKDEKDDSKLSKLFVFKSKSEIKEYDFR